MNKKDLVIVALATFCLTSTLFMILPSRSAERDPWADTSGPIQGQPDGTINMRDINYEIQHFNQDVSNMTRNVTIAGHANKLAYSIEDQPVPSGAIFNTPNIPVDGYSKMTVCLYSSTGTNEYDLYARHSGGARNFQMDLVINFTNSLVKTYDVPDQEIVIIYFNNEIAMTSMLSVDVYLIP